MADAAVAGASSAGALVGLPASDASASSQNVQVAIRIKPVPATERQAWRPLPDREGHIQQYDEAEKPVAKQLYVFGASNFVHCDACTVRLPAVGDGFPAA